MKIEMDKLTTSGVRPDGALEMSFIDAVGTPVTLHVPFAHAQSLAMTLPRLLTRALRAVSSDPSARYVFPLGHWQLEGAQKHDCVIATMTTPDGFEVSFGIPREACSGLGWALQHEAAELMAPDPVEDVARAN